MKNVFGFLLLMVFLLITVSVSFADKAADDALAIDAVMSRYDAGELTAEQAISLALKQDISYSVIVAACESRLISLSTIITAAATVGISSEVALAKMADAGVSKEKMSAAINAASEGATPGLAYTPATPRTKIPSVAPVTTNPGSTLVPRSVSPSTL